MNHVEILEDLDKFAQAHFKCKRGIYVGCCIRSRETTFSTTFNRNEGNMCNGNEGACGCIHAEAHCIISCLQHYSFDLLKHIILTMFVTVQPCLACAQLICMGKFLDRLVYLKREDRNLAGVEYIRKAAPNIEIIEVPIVAEVTR